MRILILHDFFAVKGGAEHVALTILEGLKPEHDVSLVTGYINYSLFPELENRSDIQALGNDTNIKGWESLKMIWLFKHRTQFITKYDLCIFSGIYSICASLSTKPKASIYYCHTPPRFVYDLKQYYQKQAALWQIPLLSYLRSVVRSHFERSILNMEHVLTNSINVQKRLQFFLGIQSNVLYPPVETDNFQWLGASDYYLSTARLEPYKRVDLIVQAFMKMPDRKLIVTSSGRMLPYLKKLAINSKNIHFTDWTNSTQLQELMGRCIATVYIPLNEDFGISPVESMAAGKPVIGVFEGGIQETVVHQRTGILLQPPPTIEGIRKAVFSLDKKSRLQLKEQCEKRASAFNTNIFLKNINNMIAKL